MKNQTRGFTIIELIVVVAIVAVLSSIVVANVTRYTRTAKDTAVKADMRQMTVAAADYIVTEGDYGGFCNSATAIRISTAVKAINPTYGVTCYDSEGSYFASSSDSWIAHAALAGGCAANQYAITVSGLNTSTGCWCVSSSTTPGSGGSGEQGTGLFNSCGAGCGC